MKRGASEMPASFLALYERFKHNLKLMDLALCSDYPGRWDNALEFIAHCALAHKSAPMIEMLRNMLQQDPGILTHDMLSKRLIQNFLPSLFIETDVPALISARNNLFVALNGDNEQEIFDYAVAAHNAGYINAFYDVGRTFISRQNYAIAYQAYAEVPENSRHYQAVCQELAAHYFAEYIKTVDGGYDLRLKDNIPNNPEPGKIYLEQNGYKKLNFTLKTHDGEVVEGSIEINIGEELSPEILRKLKSDILNKISHKANIDINSQKAHLENALKYTIKISDINIKGELIQELAPYILAEDSRKVIGARDPLIEEYIPAMNETTGMVGCLKLFDAIRERKQPDQDISLDDFLDTLIFRVHTMGQTAPLLTFVHRAKNKIKLMDLASHAGTFYNTLERLAQYASDVKSVPVIEMLKNMLQQDPGILADDMLNKLNIHRLETYLSDIWITTDVPALISARNILFGALNIYVALNIYNEQEIFDYAEAAYRAGYINAFYDVGTHFHSKENYPLAYQAYAKVPANSRHYQAVCQKLAEHFLEVADVALSYAIKITDLNTLGKLIEKIEPTFSAADVRDRYLLAINEATGVSGCLKLFETIRKQKSNFKPLTQAATPTFKH